jgi:hypothetical protein
MISAEGEVEGVCEGFDEEGFGEAGNAFEKAVAAGGDGDEELLNDVVLSNDSTA